MVNNKVAGFTLLEILIALFIFTILSMMLASTLHNVINLQSHVEENATRLRKIQMALLIMSRDITQAVNRPVVNNFGKEESAFVGTPISFTFTHAGFVTPGVASNSAMISGGLQRSRYSWGERTLWRTTWMTLDQTPESRSHTREFLQEVTDAHFQYLDHNGHFHHQWQNKQELPRAVRVYLTISNWGSLSQLYVISTKQPKKNKRPSNPG